MFYLSSFFPPLHEQDKPQTFIHSIDESPIECCVSVPQPAQRIAGRGEVPLSLLLAATPWEPTCSLEAERADGREGGREGVREYAALLGIRQWHV